MLTGLAGAHADSLQLNQQLLDQRIDQLAAVGLTPAARGLLGRPEQGARRPGRRRQLPALDPHPGTDTSFKIYGTISETIDYWFTGAR